MGSRKPKGKSKGFGDTIAKITHATGLNKVAEAVAKANFCVLKLYPSVV